MPLAIQARASTASWSKVGPTGWFDLALARTDVRLMSGLAEEERAFMRVCVPDADDFDNPMLLGVCHKIDDRVNSKIITSNLAAHQGLKAVPARFGVFDIHPLVDAGPVGLFSGGERGAVGAVGLVTCPVTAIPG